MQHQRAFMVAEILGAKDYEELRTLTGKYNRGRLKASWGKPGQRGFHGKDYAQEKRPQWSRPCCFSSFLAA